MIKLLECVNYTRVLAILLNKNKRRREKAQLETIKLGLG